MPKVTLTGYIIVPEKDFVSVVSELPNHIELTRSEKGCLIFEVSPDHENPNQFNVYEEFDNKESFLLHQERVGASRRGNLVKNVQCHYDIEGMKPE